MKKTFLTHLLFLPLICCILHSCSSLNELRIEGTNFQEEVSLSQNLVFTFNKNIVPKSRLDEWDSTQYVQFEPAVKGRFKWSAPNELIFSPVAGFNAATAYKASPTKLLTSKMEGEKKPDIATDPISFHTPYLQIAATESWWTISPETGRQEARVKLKFNYPVNQREVVQKLKIAAGNNAVDFKPLTYAREDEVLLSVGNAGKDSKNDLPLVISLQKGLKISNTKQVSQAEIQVDANIPSPLTLKVIDVETGFENNSGYARVITSQELDKESIANGFKVLPDTNVQAEATANGFIVKGDFNETDTYTLQISKALKGVFGQFLDEESSKDLFFGKLPSSIAFTSKKGLYLPGKGSKNIGVQIVNVPKVQVRMAKLYTNNILSYIRQNRWNEYDYVNEEWGTTGNFVYSDDTDGGFSDVLVDKIVETENLAKIKGVSALNIALPEDNNRQGVYLVTVRSKDEAYRSATKLVSISDIGLIVKHGKDELLVFANSIDTAEPISDLEITLFSTNNQVMDKVKTDGKGIARFEKLSEKSPGFKAGMLTASTEKDFNYLILNDSRVETSRFEVEGLRDNATGLQSFTYGQRDIYRPGETMYFNTVVRSAAWQVADQIPLKIRMVSPNGREYRSWRKTTNGQGSVETDVTIDRAAITGTYVLEVYNANEVLLESHAISVEEFMPDRIKVDLSGAVATYNAGSTLSLTATATNLFGPPAANRSYEMESQLSRKAFYAKNFSDYTFDIPAEIALAGDRRQGTTDDQGKAKQNFVLAGGLKDVGVLEGRIYVTVFDENGRAVNRLQKFDVFTQPVFYGIRLPDNYVGTNVPLPVEVVGLNRNGALQSGANAAVEVVRLEYQTVVEKKYEQLQYTSRKKEIKVYENTLKLTDGKGTFKYAPTVSGEYEVRVKRRGAAFYTLAKFYAYGYGATQYSSFEVSNEGRVLMETDKVSYQSGEEAKVLFKTPFDGKLLVTTERNQVLEHYILNTEKKAAELTLNIREEHLPNIFVTATLIRKIDDSDMPLTVAHGFVPLLVTSPERKLPVAITVAEKSRSKTKQQIRIKTKPDAQVTVSVVDEGILQIKNFKTPDIHGYFYQKRALEVTSHDLYAQLFPELGVRNKSSFGGDGFGLEKRINPLSNGRTQLVSFWSKVLKANGSGEVTFDVNVPQFSGDLRVMAVAYKDNAFGSASKNMKVADPIVISAAIPRFLSPGDELSLPVNISNTTARNAEASVTLQLTGPLGAVGENVQKVSLAGNKEGRAIFAVKAAQAIGLGKIVVKVNAMGETFTNETEISIRPASPLLKTASSGVIAGGKEGGINLKSTLIPATTRSQIILSRSPLVQGGGKALNTLLGYPYGCLEQTISKAFPQLYFADLTKAMAAPVYMVRSGESDLNPVTNVQQAIRKIESQQMYNGGLGMWPAATQEDWWATAYALHFLEEARRAGFEVNAKTVSRAVDYLKQQSGTTATREVAIASTNNGLEYENRGNATRNRKLVAKREAIYSLYVLALTGNANRASMNYYKQNAQLLTADSKYLLAAAFQISGDSRSFMQLLPKNYQPEKTNSYDEDSYSSSLRNLSLVLNTLLESDPGNAQIPALGRQLSQAVQSASYLNTQEAAFAVLALGKLAKKTANSTVTASASTGGKNVGTFTGKEIKIAKGIVNQNVTIRTQGSGDLYWFAQTEGMSATGAFTEEDQGLNVRRQFLTRDGAPVQKFAQNDLVVVKLTLSSTSGLPIDNVVLTDLLPAGFEIENPRITEPRDMPWIKNAAVPEYFDIRDDRLHFFTQANKQSKSFYYQVRVVSKGTFVLGPVAADAMYRGEYRSYSGGGKIKVE